MTVESPYIYKVDLRSIGTALLQLSPIILIVIYVFEYSEIYRFLYIFGVTPEEIGISEIKLLTRAALYTLAVASVFGTLFVVVGFFITANGILNWLEERPEARNTRNRSSMIESAKEASKQAKLVQIGSTVSFAVTIAVIILILKPLGVQVDNGVRIFLVIFDIVLSAMLLLRWRNKSTRYFTYACGTLLGIVLLGFATIYGGQNLGADTARTGRVPSLVIGLGVDPLQVHPEWIDKRVIPPGYAQDQDLLELGSDASTTFLYDCWTGRTVRIPLGDVVLTYPVNQTNSATLRRLRCR